jgi:hypothetical protein
MLRSRFLERVNFHSVNPHARSTLSCTAATSRPPHPWRSKKSKPHKSAWNQLACFTQTPHSSILHLPAASPTSKPNPHFTYPTTQFTLWKRNMVKPWGGAGLFPSQNTSLTSTTKLLILSPKNAHTNAAHPSPLSATVG